MLTCFWRRVLGSLWHHLLTRVVLVLLEIRPWRAPGPLSDAAGGCPLARGSNWQPCPKEMPRWKVVVPYRRLCLVGWEDGALWKIMPNGRSLRWTLLSKQMSSSQFWRSSQRVRPNELNFALPSIDSPMPELLWALRASRQDKLFV